MASINKKTECFSPTRKVEELSLSIAQENEMHPKVLDVLFDRLRDCHSRINDNPEDKNLYIELVKLESYVDTINKQHDALCDVLGELRRFWVAISNDEDFPEWDD